MRRELLLIAEMIDASEQISSLVADVDLQSLAADRQRRDALLWNFTVLGEAAAQLDESVKERFADIAWNRPAGLRNRIVHGYWSVDVEILHTTATELLPEFVAQLKAALTTLEKEPLPGQEAPAADGTASDEQSPAPS